ncbi:hypothetical protein ACH4S8_04435 [Streptomyces sp. NPDC021080]|uniref:hypothetical protein n=1 Tax=Streptomyces sp. NPDC021080 TaxID=3365110 RepID=UPI0037B190FD
MDIDLDLDAVTAAGPLELMVHTAVGSASGGIAPLIGPLLKAGKLVSDHLTRQQMAALTAAVNRAATIGLVVGGAQLLLHGVDVALRWYELATFEQRLEKAVRAEQWLDSLRAAQAASLARMEHEYRLAEARYEAVLASYPFHAPPGALAEELLLTPGGRRRPVLLLPADPPDVPAHSPWSGVRHRIVQELGAYREVVEVRAADRPFDWPHAELLRRDLDAVPALYLRPAITGYDLEIRLGGSRLLPGGMLPLLPATPVRRVGFREPGEWEPAQLRALGVASEAVPSPGRNADLNFERAARAAAFAAVMAVDAHHLLHRSAYDERVDTAAERAGLAGGGWPPGLGVPLELVADPPYHLLHQALRYTARGQGDAALFAAAAAAAWLAGEAVVRPGRIAGALERAVASGRMTAAHARKFREVLPALGREGRLPRSLARALDRLPAAPPERPPTVPPAAGGPPDEPGPGLFPPAGRPLL